MNTVCSLARRIEGSRFSVCHQLLARLQLHSEGEALSFDSASQAIGSIAICLARTSASNNTYLI